MCFSLDKFTKCAQWSIVSNTSSGFGTHLILCNCADGCCDWKSGRCRQFCRKEESFVVRRPFRGVDCSASFGSSIVNQIQVYPTISWSRILLEKQIVAQLLKIPIFYGTWKVITVFTKLHSWFLLWIKLIQSTPFHPISLRSILISWRPLIFYFGQTNKAILVGGIA
jgi:hypothetical protein